MEWWSLILIVVAALTIAFLSGVTLFAWRFTKNTFTRHRFSKTTSKRNRKKLVSNESDYYKFLKAATERLNDYIPENLEILSDDGLKLVGYYYRTMNLSLKTVIGVHGYCGDAKKDLASVVPFLLEAGYNISSKKQAPTRSFYTEFPWARQLSCLQPDLSFPLK